MNSDLDTYRTASIHIREHGEDAALEAAQRADIASEEIVVHCGNWFVLTAARTTSFTRRDPPFLSTIYNYARV